MPQTSVETSTLESDNITSSLAERGAELRGAHLPHFVARPVTLLFEEQVTLNPNATAVVCEDQQLSYAELNLRANQLAHYLRSLGVGRESLVGICIDRSLEMATGILAILKAGAGYLPLDPEYPSDRLAFMIEDAKPAVVLTKSDLSGENFSGARTVLFDGHANLIAEQPTDNRKDSPASSDLAYVIYTSGSTGQPKGVMIEHRNLSNYLSALNHELRIEPRDIYLHTASIAFSSSRRQLLLPLSRGASVIVASSDERKDPMALLRMVKERGITVMDAVPSFWRNCTSMLESLDENERVSLIDNRVRLMLSASEPLATRIPRTWMQRFNHSAQHVHMFGQTETAGIVCLFKVPRDYDGENYVPIGHPIANTEIRILDHNRKPCPNDEPGELYIGGAGVGRGYLNRPDLTAEKFINIDGVAFYRTGDWARLRDDHQIEFAGRRDQQVKLRGFRVELGEVEAALSQHPGVRECAVIARNGNENLEKRLLAYYVRRNGAINSSELRQYMDSRLPEYAVPSLFLEIEALPLSANGKVNRLALPEPSDSRAGVSTEFQAPQNDFEKQLSAIWAEVLRIDQIGRNDNFIELGGHSLLAAQVVARIRRELKIEAPISMLLGRPTIAGLAVALARADSEAIDDTIRPFERNGTAPLSFNQQQFWLLDQSNPNRSAYNVRTALRIRGELDFLKLQQSIDSIIARHEVLRTNIVERDGVTLQAISDSLVVPLAYVDLSQSTVDSERSIERALDEEASQPFDLGTGPLLRARLLKLATEEYVLLLTLHHIVCDGWSIDLLLRELTTNYRDLVTQTRPRASTLPIQYADFALWQRSDWRASAFAKQVEFWKQELAGAPTEIELPIDFPRPVTPSFAGGRVSATLPREASEALRSIGRSEGATLFMTMLAAFQTLLLRYTGQEDIVVGCPVAARTAVETENLIGAFVNTILLRGKLSGNPTFRELLKQVRETSLNAFANQDVPFEKIVEVLNPERKPHQTPLFQVMFSYRNFGECEFDVAGTRFTLQRIQSETAKFDLTLEVEDTPEELSISFEYAKDLFATETIERMRSHFCRLVTGIISNPDEKIAALPLMADAERQQLLDEWNSRTFDVPSNTCVHQLFEAQVASAPDAIAAEFSGQRMTYGDLNKRGNQLANYLRKRGVGPEVKVGISIERSLEMLVSILGVMKAGGAYVPLDPNYPQERLAFMIRDADLRLVITTEKLAKSVPSDTPLLVIDRDWSRISCEAAQDLECDVKSTSLAYVIYTSGSTGNPKGVAIEHRSLTNFILTAAAAYEVMGRDRALQFASLSFDLSVEEIFVPLTHGAGLVLRSEEMISSPRDFLGAVESWKLSILDLPTAYWHELTDALTGEGLELPPNVRLVIIGGEKAAPDRVRAWQRRIGDRARLVNTYGPTETTVAVTLYDLADEQPGAGVIPIGRPLPNTRAYVLDAHAQPVPIGVAGELYIGGPGVARGYLNRPDLTAEKFIPDLFSREKTDRLYRTGDRVRYRTDGQIEFLGRIDNQVKIRGFRVELEEIEQALRAYPVVKDCVVDYNEAEQRLIAYLVASEGQVLSINDLRNSLKTKLPSYMIPSGFETLGALPLTPNGKVNRRALPKPTANAEIDDAFAAPSTPIEELLASVWSEVLKLPQVGRHDNFFDSGGHSLLAAKVVSLTRNRINIDLTIVDLFQAPTIATLAEVLTPRVAEREARDEFDRLMREIAALTDAEAQDVLNEELQVGTENVA